MSERMRQRWLNRSLTWVQAGEHGRSLIKISVSIAMVGVVGWRLDPGAVVQQVVNQSLFWLLAAAVVILGQIGIAAIRWRIIMSALRIDTPLRTVLSVTYIASFFNCWLLGSMSGDIARALLTPNGENDRAAIVHSVLLDRMMTLVGLALCTLGVMLFDSGSPAVRRWYPVLLVTAVVPMAAIVFMAPLTRFVGSFGLPFSSHIQRLAADWLSLHRAKGRFAAALAFSVVGSGAISATAWCLGQAQHFNVSFVDFLLLMPPVVLLTALPISVGGWGVRENALVVALGLLGIGTAAATVLSVQMGLLVALLSLPGGGLWLGYRPGTRASALRQASAG